MSGQESAGPVMVRETLKLLPKVNLHLDYDYWYLALILGENSNLLGSDDSQHSAHLGIKTGEARDVLNCHSRDREFVLAG